MWALIRVCSPTQPEVKPDVAVGGSEHINLKVTGSVSCLAHQPSRNRLGSPFFASGHYQARCSFFVVVSDEVCIHSSQDRSVVHFKIKKNTPLRKLMTAYCERQGFQAGTVRFMFDGNQVGAEQTPIEVILFLSLVYFTFSHSAFVPLLIINNIHNVGNI